MKKFLFGNQTRIASSLGITACLLMAIGVPAMDWSEYRSSGWYAFAWQVWWLISVPGLVWVLIKERRNEYQAVLAKIFK